MRDSGLLEPLSHTRTGQKIHLTKTIWQRFTPSGNSNALFALFSRYDNL